jgi:translation initiation factor IF-3
MIRISPIRLIDENNEQVGIVETRDAMQRAEQAGLDLVEIQPDVRPPVCKIMDYGKYKYEQSKKEQKNRAASKQQEMKEVRLGRSIKIDPHDVQIRVEQARKFLLEGHKVQLVQQFRGREMMHQDLGRERLQAVIDSLSDIAKIDSPPRQAGRRMTMVMSPDKPKIEAYKRRQQKERDEAERAKEAEKEAHNAEQQAQENEETSNEGERAEAEASRQG